MVEAALLAKCEGKNQKGIFPAGVDFTTDTTPWRQFIFQEDLESFRTVIKS